MANNFGLNTAQHPGLNQVLLATEDGLFDYKAQQSASKVVVSAAEARKLAAARTLKNPANGLPYLTES